MKPPLPMLDDSAILAVTRAGEHELREPGTTLSTAQLEALVLIGGRSSVAQVLKRGHAIAPDVLKASLQELIDKKLVAINPETTLDMIDPGDFFNVGPSGGASREIGDPIHAKVDSDTEFLRQNGYYVNMVRKRSSERKLAEGRKLNVLIIEDEPDICKLLQICLRLEGLDTRTAPNREAIVAAFRTSPLPDLVLLDVLLPDVNGFDVLTKMRDNQLLREVPVIMLTALATREAVLKGILGRADGFVTKPFQIENLVRAVRTILGLPGGS